MPRLGLGVSGALGWTYITNRRDALRLILEAHEQGIRHFDTGHSYCAGEAEVTLGMAVAEIGRGNVFLSTKLGTKAVGRLGRVVQSFSHRDLEESLTTSLRRLRCETIELLMLHSPPSGEVKRGLDFLCDARERGLTSLIGASIAPEQLQLPDVARCDVVMVKHSLSNPLAPSAIERTRAMGVWIIAKRALAVDDGGSRALLPRGLRRADLWYSLRMLKNRVRRPVSAAAPLSSIADRLQFVLATVDGAVFGSTRAEHVRANAIIARDMGLLDSGQ
jgi:aryl-alcohol dehydrogenase-like predicted oxidoreductase